MNKNNKPIIGIVSKHLKKNASRPNMYIRDEVKQAIFDNGGICIGILLPKDEIYDVGDSWDNNFNEIEYENLISQISLCDGIIFQGGAACDNYEMIIAKYCYENDIPTLGICCGQNVLVRALGGSTKLIEDKDKHHNDEIYAHSVKIIKNTKLSKIIEEEVIEVNSRHNRTVDTHPNLIANCICEDGYIDGVESIDKTFYMAFRFHPESLYKIDEYHNNIFKEFIKVCKEKREMLETEKKLTKNYYNY